ncbi:hypothetical protein ACFPT7_02065 [Acidicapsa dinghuensis]|uniref:Nucleotide pyrophosphohydrolase n=1 Tax=Acidicapsa dinghuensis TaxID=2218256 RepID=A0ABW1E9R2_9BACT|nr:hypothetical protein [Acidicapsa dinghuensis]
MDPRDARRVIDGTGGEICYADSYMIAAKIVRDHREFWEERMSRAEMTFAEFQRRNIARSRIAFPTCNDWSLNDWAVALVGEAGELCNLLKKNRRALATDERFLLDGPFYEQARQAVIDELADVIIYADLMLSQLGASTAEAVGAKFDEVSKRVGYVDVGELISAPPSEGGKSIPRV